MRALPLLLLLSAVPLLAAPTDLAIAAPGNVAPLLHVAAGRQFVAPTSIFNLGPAEAQGVTVTYAGTAAFVPVSSNCVQGPPVRCAAFGPLPVNRQVPVELISFQLVAPAQPGTFPLRFVVNGADQDPNPANNTLEYTLVVEGGPDLHAAFPLSTVTARIDPNGLLSERLDVHNSAPLVDAHDVTLRVTATGGEIAAIDSSDAACTLEGGAALCRIPFIAANARQVLSFVVTGRASGLRDGGTLSIVATLASDTLDADPNDNIASAGARIYRWISVRSTADTGAGTLRAAIAEANAGCVDPCKIAFEIDEPLPEEGFFTIRPETPLPAITGTRVIVDGFTQRAFRGDTNPFGPEVALDGSRLAAGDGIRIATRCDGHVRGLAVGNFPQYGISLGGGEPCAIGDAFSATSNFVGTDATGRRAMPNLRGIRIGDGETATLSDNLVSGNRRSGFWVAGAGSATIQQNYIGIAADGRPMPNGASGVFCGLGTTAGCDVLNNLIAFNGDMGVAAERGTDIEVRRNSMRGNGGLGIDIGLDGPNAPLPDDRGRQQSNPPTVLSAVYDAVSGTTTLQVKVDSKPLGPYSNVFDIDVYANDTADGEGEEWLGSQLTPYADTVVTIVVKRNLTGRWINATTTRRHYYAAKPPQPDRFGTIDLATSELSPAVQVTR